MPKFKDWVQGLTLTADDDDADEFAIVDDSASATRRATRALFAVLSRANTFTAPITLSHNTAYHGIVYNPSGTADLRRLTVNLQTSGDFIVRLTTDADATSHIPLTIKSGGNVEIGGQQVRIGEGATASGGDAVAIGENTTASGQDDIAIGDDAVASGGYSIAIGSSPDATAQDAIAIGRNVQVAGIDAVAIGDSSSAAGADAIAIGVGSSASATDAIAIGDGATASHSGAVAIGDGTATTAADQVHVGGRTIAGLAATADGATDTAARTTNFDSVTGENEINGDPIGDTGWIDLTTSATLRPGVTATYFEARRIGNQVTVRYWFSHNAVTGGGSTTLVEESVNNLLGTGWRYRGVSADIVSGAGNGGSIHRPMTPGWHTTSDHAAGGGLGVFNHTSVSLSLSIGQLTWTTEDTTWPT